MNFGLLDISVLTKNLFTFETHRSYNYINDISANIITISLKILRDIYTSQIIATEQKNLNRLTYL
jgi:hypothetical protein